MTMLATVIKFCKRRNIDVPSTVLGTTDTQVQQVLALLEEEGNDLADRGDWQQLTFEATHTTVATESQGAMTTIASNGFSYIKYDTIWDRTLSLKVPVMSSTEWQQLKAIPLTGPRYQARIRGGNLIVTPTPTAGNTWAFEYVSKNWILGADGTTYSDSFNLDTDTLLLPEKIILMGLTWRWKKEKGLSYAEDYNAYERMVSNEMSRNGMKAKVNFGKTVRNAEPKIVVTDGSWNL